MSDSPNQIPNSAKLLAKKIFDLIKNTTENKPVIAISGESGSGKTTLATALASVLHQHGYKTTILHLDDYFYLPPKTNELARKKNIKQVGPQEVNLNLLQSHVQAFKYGIPHITKPKVIYSENKFVTETLDFARTKVLIVEGTYTFDLQGIDLKIFIDLDYHQTEKRRIKRGRETIDQFLNQVLEIEHQIISRYKSRADLIVTENNNLKIYLT